MNLPPNAANLPKGAQALFRRAVAEGGMAAGWREVKKAYAKNEKGVWVKAKEEA